MEELTRISEEEIRRSCCGGGIYWAGEMGQTATDRAPTLMPQFTRTAQAQLEADKSKVEAIKSDTRQATAREILGEIEKTRYEVNQMTTALGDIPVVLFHKSTWLALKQKYLKD